MLKIYVQIKNNLNLSWRT